MRRILITFAFFLIAATLVVLFLFTNTFSIKTIEVESELTPEEEVRVLSGIRTGRNILLLNTDTVRDNLLKDARIDRAQVEKIYPNKINIKINERKPFAVVTYQGQYLILDETAKIIQITDQKPDLPLIDGFVLTRAITGEHVATSDSNLFAQALNIVQLYYQTDLENIRISFEDAQVVLYPVQTLQVKFGRAENVERQFSNFMEVYRQLKEDDSLQGIIDVSNVEMAVYRPFTEE